MTMTQDQVAVQDADQVPSSFADAYEELQSIAARLKPTPGLTPDIDAIEPLIRRANLLARYCQDRIEAVRRLIGEQTDGR